jgi:hypothetical protein
VSDKENGDMKSSTAGLDDLIKRYVELHPGQHTMADLAAHLASLNGHAPEDYLTEIRAMMGTDLSLTAARTVAVR